jgi:hypothetical protein
MHIFLTKHIVQKQSSFKWKKYSCLALVILADWLFFNQVAGWTLGIFSAVLLAVFLFYNKKVLLHSQGKTLVFLMFGLCLELIYNPNKLSILLTILGFASLALIAKQAWLQDTGTWLKNTFKVFLSVFSMPFIMLGSVKSRKRSKFKNNFLSHWLLPLFCTSIFLGLFAIANPIIQEWISHLDGEFILKIFDPWQFIYCLFMGLICWCIIRPQIPFLKPKPKIFTDTHLRNAEYGAMSFLFNSDSIKRSLFIFNLIFLVQTTLDIIYLWGGKKLPSNFTYAEYAHRGAYPLIATALLAGLFVMVTLKPGTQGSKSKLVRSLVYLWIAQNIFLVISSIWRTCLYIETYSLTRLRVAALIWMTLVMIGLVFLLVRVFWNKNNTWLINMNALSLFAVLYLFCFTSTNGFIANYNLNKYLKCTQLNNCNVSFDGFYLDKLSVEALPVIKRYLNECKTESGTYEHRFVLGIQKKLNNKLIKSLGTWQGWTLHNQLLFLELQSK